MQGAVFSNSYHVFEWCWARVLRNVADPCPNQDNHVDQLLHYMRERRVLIQNPPYSDALCFLFSNLEILKIPQGDTRKLLGMASLHHSLSVVTLFLYCVYELHSEIVDQFLLIAMSNTSDDLEFAVAGI